VLFETIYGPDAESIYRFLSEKGKNVSIKEVHMAFVPRNSEGKLKKTKNIEDAISFLKSTGFVQGNKVLSSKRLPFEDFRLSLLHSLREIEINKDHVVQDELDRYYLRILTVLFVEQNLFYLRSGEIHKLANSMKGLPKGITKTKVGAWKRIMEYLGLGFRDTTGGFYCVYNDEVVKRILLSWPEKDGIIQNLMETHFNRFLPWKDNKGRMSEICQASFLRLARQNVVRLLPKQDLSATSYFPQQYRGIELI